MQAEYSDIAREFHAADFFKDYPAPAGGDPVIIPAAPAGDAAATDSAPTDAAPAPAGGAIPLDGFMPTGDTRAANGGSANGDANGHAAEEEEPTPEPVEECAAVVNWRREFAAGLEAKVTNERKVKAERAEQARETLAKMHGGWTKKNVETEDVNKKNEKEFLRDRDALLARMSKPGDPPAWGVIPELVDMTGKFKEGARDTSRMRQVLMKLKTY